jgi:WD40 repeat protein
MTPKRDTLLVSHTGSGLSGSGLSELDWTTGTITREFPVPLIPHDYGDDEPLISAIIITRSGTVVASCVFDALLLWDYVSGEHKGLVRGDNELPVAPNEILECYPLAVSPSGDWLVWGNTEERLQVLDTNTWKTTIRTERQAQASALQVLAGSRHVIASSYKGIFLWDLETGRVIHEFHGHTGRVECVAVTADGEFAFSSSDDMTIRAWHLPTRSSLSSFQADNRLTVCAVSADARVVAVGTRTGTVEFFNWRP